MSVFSRLFGGRDGGRATPARFEPPLQAQASGTANPDPWLLNIGFGGRQSNVTKLPRVTATTGEKHATSFACCNVVAGDLSKVPLKLWQRTRDGREVRVRDHPAAYLLNVEASPGVPARVARMALAYSFLLRGNSYAYAPRSGAGEIEMLDLLHPDLVAILRSGRDRFYEFEDGAGVFRRVSSRSAVHLRYLALDGWSGRSPLQVAAESFGIALAGQEAAARTAVGGTTRGVIKIEDVFEDDEAWQRNAQRVRNAIEDPENNGWPIIGTGDDVKSLDLSAADQQLLQSRKFDREQIMGIYRVPPSKLQILEYGVKANGPQQALDYKTDCLLHWGGLLEDQLMLSILTEKERRSGLFFRHDFEALLQATAKESYDALKTAIGGPVMTPNEGRNKMGLDPIEGGDLLNPAPNMTRDTTATKATKE